MTVTTMTIEGLGSVKYNINEYIDQPVFAAYQDYMEAIKAIYDKRISNPDYNGTPLTAADYDNLINALNSLSDLAKNGLRIQPSGSTLSYTGYMGKEMAQRLDLVMRSLQAAGINYGASTGLSDSQKIELIQNWQSLAGYGVEAILEEATAPPSSVYYTRSLQSMVELEYVKEGNDLIAINLSDLEETLRIDNDILKTLTVVQNISNQIKVENTGSPTFAFPPTKNGDLPHLAQEIIGTLPGDDQDQESIREGYYQDLGIAQQRALARNPVSQAEYEQFTQEEFDKLSTFADRIRGNTDSNGDELTKFMQLYKIAASAQFTQVFPTATPTSSALSELLTAKTDLMNQLAQLEAAAPDASRSVVNSLAYFVYKVALDISAAFQGVNPSDISLMTTALKKWILDNQDKAINSTEGEKTGDIQQNITQAIQAAENLNDTQKEKVRNYMFIFEQFYRSSSAILQKVTQLIERMAQGISR